MRVILVVLLLVFLAGCGGGSFSGPNNDGQTDDDFKTGSSAVAIDFMSNAPPRDLIMGQNANLALKLTNRGAYDVDLGYVFVSADKSLFDFEDDNMLRTFSLEGKSETWPQGEAEVISYPFATKNLVDQSQKRNALLIATVCYDYKTEVFEYVCVDTDPYNLKPNADQKPCQTSDITPGTSGGPVNIQKISVTFDQEDTFFRPRFIFDIVQTNRQGLVYAYGQSSSFCSSSGSRTDISNKVSFKAYMSDRLLSCDKGVVTLVEGGARVVCETQFLDTSQTTYEAPLTVVLEYGFSNSKTKEVLIGR